ncbi:epoxide hydrolase [Flavitalea sp. BT771]|uniref:epoxide hydrolase family protein n=1 Tax=Flavitalea sp. BT771 TaxID=3063329 RepID=UPI0026E41E5A|nr:epoxide hydrolase family protein [Flavitalea sp. BT771]MDO6432680.1 epoxide hydrolase [Flavitalea sp. BT771]MDV6222044.1 epoxide hydrolase [Flavitalea sp. BT771]
MKPFKINVPQEVLNDLSIRLKQTRWTDEPENGGWDYGTNPGYLRELVRYWQTEYDWRTHEAAINQFPQFKAEIDGVTIHFIHIKGQGRNSAPLILNHGWPDSFYRFIKIIPMLTEPSDNGRSYDLVIPSIPGFGFSQQTALNSDKTAILFNKLMTEVLGYPTYFAAGGDMGTLIVKSLAVQFPANVKAIHLTDVGYPNGSEDWSTMTPAEQAFGQQVQHWFFTEGAFNMIQSTKPQTLGYALNDSPVGLASWIIEKFHAWSDHNGNPGDCFTMDELITNIMIYWVSQSINSTIRTYAENARAGFMGGLQSSQRVSVPTGVSLFPKEAQFPKEWAERMANVVSFRIMEKGGHFAAMEQPEVYARELTSYFEKI